MAALFGAHPLVLQTAYSDLKRRALEQRAVLIGTPGSVSVRRVRDQSFVYRQFYDAGGAKRAEYLGAATDPETETRARETRERIETANGLLATTRLLTRGGYLRGDTQSGAVVAALANHGLFRAGAVLVGSHAYGILLNELGIRTGGFRTEDVDIARAARLTLPEGTTLERVLGDSTLSLTPVLGFDRKVPATSYKSPGKEGLRVDLLVPTTGHEIVVRSVPELAAHATAVPYLGYLLVEPIEAVFLGRESVVPVVVPRPECLAWHKMLVSQLRTATSDKRTKDVHQAAVLFAALAEQDPAALTDAFRTAPAKTKTRAGAKLVVALLRGAGHERAGEVLSDVAGV